MFITTNANSLLLVQILNCKFDSKGKNMVARIKSFKKKQKQKQKQN